MGMDSLELMIYYGLLFHLINTEMITRSYSFDNNYTLKSRDNNIYLLKLTKIDEIGAVKNPLKDERNNFYKANIIRKNDREKLSTLILLDWKRKLLIKNPLTLEYIIKKIVE